MRQLSVTDTLAPTEALRVRNGKKAEACPRTAIQLKFDSFSTE
jgi:hypothetical protein